MNILKFISQHVMCQDWDEFIPELKKEIKKLDKDETDHLYQLLIEIMKILYESKGVYLKDALSCPVLCINEVDKEFTKGRKIIKLDDCEYIDVVPSDVDSDEDSIWFHTKKIIKTKSGDLLLLSAGFAFRS